MPQISINDRNHVIVLHEENYRTSKYCGTIFVKIWLKGLCGYQKTFLMQRHKNEKRLRFAKEHIKWQKNQWDKVLFMNKSKFQFFGTNKHQYVRRRKRKH